MRRTISPETWQQARTAHASGIGLRELARNMSLPEGTVLARAKRQGWTRQIQQAKTLATRPADSSIVAPAEAAAVTMRERAARHVVRIAGITERVLPHLESMEPANILTQARNLERLDYTARRNYGLDDDPLSGRGCLDVDILTTEGAIRIRAGSPDAPEGPVPAGSCLD